MNRAELEIKGAEALMTQFAPGTTGAGISPTLGRVYRDRARVVVDAVEADIRADEREQLAATQDDHEGLTAHLRCVLDEAGLAAGQSDRVALAVTAAVGALMTAALSEERMRTVRWLRTEHTDALGHPLSSNELANAIQRGVELS